MDVGLGGSGRVSQADDREARPNAVITIGTLNSAQVYMTHQATPDDLSGKRASVIDAMVSSISSRKDRRYYVGLVGYYIEGTRYSASGLSVDLFATPDVCRTETGFACSALSPPQMIEPDVVRAKGITKVNLGGEIRDAVRVRLEVMIDDVWSVAEFVEERQQDLFLDSDALRSGLDLSRSTSH